MSDIERLVAIEEIKQLKSRRDRAIDEKNWALLESLHAPDHVSDIDGHEQRKGAAEMVRGIRDALEHVACCHQSHTLDVTVQSVGEATIVSSVEDNHFWMQDGEEHWLRGFGYYEERCEKRDGRWVFNYRRLKRIKVLTSPGAIFPPKSPSGDSRLGGSS